MRFTFLVVLLLATHAVAAPRQSLDTLTPVQAISRAAAAAPKPVRALFQMKVARATKSRDGFYLDSQGDFHSAGNLGVAIKASAMAGLTQKYGADLKAAFTGKTIKLIGQVQRVSVGKGSAVATQIEVTHAGQILSVS